MLYLFKGRFQKIIRWIGGDWMTANMATLGGCLFVVLTSACFFHGLSGAPLLLLAVPFCLLFRMVMNALDGMLAREHGTGSVAGEIWNEALDVLGDTICYGGLFFVTGGPRISLVLFLLAIWAAEFFGVMGRGMPGGVRRHETFFGGKPDRAIWMGCLALIVFFRPGFFEYIPLYLLVAFVFVVLTSGVRIQKTIAAARGREYKSYTWIGR